MTERQETWTWRIGFATIAVVVFALTIWAAWCATPMLEFNIPAGAMLVRVEAHDAAGQSYRVGPRFGRQRAEVYCDGLRVEPQGNVRTCHIWDAAPDLTYQIRQWDRWKRPIWPVVTCQHGTNGWTCR